MKQLTTLLTALPFVALVACQSADPNTDEMMAIETVTSGTLPSRQILVEGVRIWQASYDQLVKDSVFGNSGHRDSLVFSLNLLNELREKCDTCENINFWIYLEEDIPKFALANEGDSSQLLIDVDGAGRFVSYNSLQAKFAAWKDLVHATEGGLVYVKLYRYNWASLMTLIGTESNLCIENVAHTVHANSEIYEVIKRSTTGAEIEGYIALDVI